MARCSLIDGSVRRLAFDCGTIVKLTGDVDNFILLYCRCRIGPKDPDVGIAGPKDLGGVGTCQCQHSYGFSPPAETKSQIADLGSVSSPSTMLRGMMTSRIAILEPKNQRTPSAVSDCSDQYPFGASVSACRYDRSGRQRRNKTPLKRKRVRSSHDRLLQFSDAQSDDLRSEKFWVTILSGWLSISVQFTRKGMQKSLSLVRTSTFGAIARAMDPVPSFIESCHRARR